MKRTTTRTSLAVGIAIALALAPGAAFAESGDAAHADDSVAIAGALSPAFGAPEDQSTGEAASLSPTSLLSQVSSAAQAARSIVERANKVLPYDAADIAAIGTQEQSGHTICCPSFSCAYADAVLDGTVNDHGYYTCSCCTWPNWGGGGSWNRCVGSNQDVLREAYDQIAAGKPTVVHVTSGSGEHWVALIGYQGVADPGQLSEENFIALDPWDGAQITLSDRYRLYGDGCQHISDR